ncbi:unnamed protein product [Leptidea sinapis]|uniref:THO complex subunit 2 n=1 Tax=Leptidea sinapis TaxID=189913 RepID=A0A5E4PW43_9NEOP|nr:unnamed protein product [Leptidea sinapis]
MSATPKFVLEYCKNWDKSGKDQYVKFITQHIKDENKSPLFTKSGKLSGFSQGLYDLLICGLKGYLKKDAVILVLREIIALHADIPSILLDVICVLDAETSLDVQNEERVNFCYVVRELEPLISDKLLKERLEIDTLQDVGTLKNKNFYTKFIKVKTKLYYKQRKFNLFREESEGYAKLIVELNQEIAEETDWKNILEIIQSLIGCFNLDPNRVLDIILESFEARPHLDKLFISLIRGYMCDPQVISEVLGFKLSNMEVLESYKEPPNLMVVIALLLQHQVISLDNIYPWLRPDDTIMAKETDREIKLIQDFIRKLNIVSTKGPQANCPTEFVEEKPDPQEYWANQKLVLGEALLRVRAWREFSSLYNRLPITAMPQRPATALCDMLHALVEPLYRNQCRVAPKIIGKPVPPLKSTLAPKACKTFEDMKDTVIPALILLGPTLHYDPILMYKIIRILRASRSVPEDPLHHEALTVLDAAVLPALSLMEGNCCMAEEVYTLLRLYSYQCRYCLYARWKNDSGEKIPSLMRVRGNSLQRIKHIMKRVSKENIKPQGRLIGKLSHAAPAFLFDYMLLQIQMYDNLIGPVVESLKYLTSLSLDVLGYCLVEALCSGRGVEASGAAHPPWLQALAAFAGAAFKKHNIELTAEEMTQEQLEAMAGGELLKGEAGYFSQVRNTRRSSARLKDAVVGNNLDIALCILAAQQRHCCVWKECNEDGTESEASGSQLKVVGRLADQCQDALVQLGTFLASSHTPGEYAARLPPLPELLRDYHVDADVAFFLHRPVLTQKITAKIESLRKSSDTKSDSLEKSIERYNIASKEALDPIVTSITPLLPARVWEDISPEFYVTFWSLSMYDLRVPVESYEREISRLKAAAAVLIKLAQIIERKIEKVKEEEKIKRPDLYVLATGYSGQLRNKVPSMMLEGDFHQMSEQNKPPAAQTISVKEDSTQKPQEVITSPQQAPDVEKKSSDRRREDSDRDKDTKRETRMSVKDRSKDELLRSKDKSPRDRSHREDRYLEAVSPPHDSRHPSDDIDRDVKRRKVEGSSNGKGSKDIEERSPEKEKRKTKVRGDDRKERKMNRKRDRVEESTLLEQKRRRDEQKAAIKLPGHQNGSQDDHHYEKYHKREKSPFRDRSHEEQRDKHRRSNESKVRR